MVRIFVSFATILVLCACTAPQTAAPGYPPTAQHTGQMSPAEMARLLDLLQKEAEYEEHISRCGVKEKKSLDCRSFSNANAIMQGAVHTASEIHEVAVTRRNPRLAASAEQDVQTWSSLLEEQRQRLAAKRP